MCAINGITAENENLVERMNELTQHRGPDGHRVWAGDGITLGHNRLAIIDLADRSLQPMQSTNGRYHIVFNGEIYNYKELRQDLIQRYQFQTEGDTEVLLAAYQIWGKDMFSRLRGMFAFGIWDQEKKELLLARDHMGIKPLYYTIHDRVLSFSSEIPALLLTVSDRLLNLDSLGLYLSMEYVPGPETLVEGVKKLRPGQMLRFKDGLCSVESFLDSQVGINKITEGEVYHTIDSAVKRQLVSDRPIGAYLSGGFDSSIVVHHMTKYSPHVRTYSVDFEAVKGQEDASLKFNTDARLAERTAKIFGTEHKTFKIHLDDVRGTLEEASASANEPIANSTAITQYLLSDFVRKDGVVVVLGGDGGDELFGGYTRHRLATAAYLYQRMPYLLQYVVGCMSPRVKKLMTPFGAPIHRTFMAKDGKKIAPYVHFDMHIDESVSRYFNAAYNTIGINPVHPIDRFMRVDRHTWLPDECFIRSDYASMAHGVELRVPFVDLDVVTCADQISIWKKTLPHEGKRIIRRVYKTHLPPHLYREPKRGWLSPAAKWFRDPVIYDFAKEVFSSGYYDGLSKVFDWEQVQNMLDAHVRKEGYYLYPLWNILVLQIWSRKNLLTIHQYDK